MTVHYLPEGYHNVIPYLVIDGAARAIDFYREVFGAVEVMRMSGPDGKIGHAEIKIGDSPVMLADESPEQGQKSLRTIGGSPVSLMVYVDDVDAVFKRAVAAGGKETRAVANQFYGDRTGGIEDPFGYHWYLATHVEDVSPDEIARRAKAMETTAD